MCTVTTENPGKVIYNISIKAGIVCIGLSLKQKTPPNGVTAKNGRKGL